MSNKILILGAGGYIGSALSIQYPEADVWDSKWLGIEKPINAKRFWQSDIRIYDTIIYLAGLSGVNSCTELRKTHENNVVAFEKVLNELRGDQKFIYASSASIYGDNGGNYGTENCSFKHSLTYYDMGMFARESLAQMANLAGKKTYGLRFGTVAGCMSGQTVIRDNTAINGMVKSAIVNNHINISKYWTHRGFLGIKDLCGFVNELVINDIEPGIFNVVSFNSCIDEVAAYISDKFKINSSVVQGTNPYDFRMSTAKMREIYRPKCTLKTIEKDLDDNRKNLIYTEWKEWKPVEL